MGIDVAKERLDVALLPGGKEFSEPNDAGAIKRLVKRLLALGCERVALEASGGYETLLVGALGGGRVAGGGDQSAPGA